jgi:hypothetical protein
MPSKFNAWFAAAAVPVVVADVALGAGPAAPRSNSMPKGKKKREREVDDEAEIHERGEFLTHVQ